MSKRTTFAAFRGATCWEVQVRLGHPLPLSLLVVRPPAVPSQGRPVLMSSQGFSRSFLAGLGRPGLRRALWLLRRQDARPFEVSPAAAQYDRLATPGSVRAEYRRRGWKIPRPTRAERA